MSAPITIDGYRIEPLTRTIWPAYADLIEKHNGIWGGCWCLWFHRPLDPEERTLGGRALKEKYVAEDRTHAAVVLKGEQAVAWCQFGTVAELHNIHHRKEWEKGVTQPPDFRLTCLFVDRDHRRDGLAEVAVRGALRLIARAGGGRVEAYPHDLPAGKKVSASFLYNSTRTMYERLGFTYDRPKGKSNCVMWAVVEAYDA